MGTAIIVFLAFLLFQTWRVSGGGGWVFERNQYAVQRMVWSKMATVCMRRDVTIMYKVKYSTSSVCCPKFLLYSDEQYQRIVFLKALQILQEEEYTRRTGRREIKPSGSVVVFTPQNGSTLYYPNRKRRSTAVGAEEHAQGNMKAAKTTFLHPNNAGAVHTKNSREVNRRLRNYLEFYFGKRRLKDVTYRQVSPVPIRRRKNIMKRDIKYNDSSVTYADVIDRLYFGNNSLLLAAERRIHQTASCDNAREELTNVLDRTQVIPICPNAGILVAPGTRGYRACDGVIRPMDQVFLPGLTRLESWFGDSEVFGGNPDFPFWQKNTWHLALLNCPGGGGLKITYEIDFDVAQNGNKTSSDSTYVNPNLRRKCSGISFPPYETQDGIGRGSGTTIYRQKLSRVFGALVALASTNLLRALAVS